MSFEFKFNDEFWAKFKQEAFNNASRSGYSAGGFAGSPKQRKIALVQCYINHIEGVTPQIRRPQTMREMRQLEQAYNDANRYFEEYKL